jgi:transcription-repair coupling factor (superfamily II helicase)
LRDLELRGAGDLLGEEQSGHVAAVGFELYVSLLDDAVQELRSADGTGAAEAQVRLDVDVDAYLPADYIPFEAAKIDVHRRLAGAREPGELRALRDELRDRFGPLPEPVESLFELQRARVELARLGARAVEFRGERLSVTPLELDAGQIGRLRERIPEATYESRSKTLSVRVPDQPEARLAAVLGLADAAAGAVAEPVAA